MSIRGMILGALRVPPTPTAPPGSPPRVFRAAPNYFMLKMLGWAGTQLLAVIGLAVAIFAVSRISQIDMPKAVLWLLRAGEIFGIAAVAARFVFGWMIVRYDFELRWYMLSDRAIRIREGIVTIREKTIALANIQNISIQQGPLQRLLGIADVEVKTAGGGGLSPAEVRRGRPVAEPMHVAYFRGVGNATEIRNLVAEGVRRQRDTGLGDPDEPHQHAPAPAGIDEAIAELLAEARALRRAMS